MSKTIIDDLSLEALATGALNQTYTLGPTATVETNVNGDSRNIASVNVNNGSLQLWSVTLMQVAPEATVPNDLILGNLTIKAGAKFTLTIPTSVQQGSVLMQCTVVTPTNPDGQLFSASVAHWPLVSK